MRAVFEEARRLLANGESFVVATVIGTRGSTPQKPGARLLIRRDGTIAGTLGGGCVEADVRIEARRLLDGGGPAALRRFRLDEDIAFKDGLVCGGTMDVLIDPLTGEARDRLTELEEILRAYAGEGDRALALRYATPEEAERRPVPLGELGAPVGLLFVRADGRSAGTLGDRDVDATVARAARQLMPRGREDWIDLDDGSRVYVEAFTRPARAVIAGGGHVGKAIYELASLAGFHTVIVDDRPDFANTERFPRADRVVVDDFDRGLRSVGLGPNDYVVVATRGHKLDDVALLEAARSEAGYVGLLGSRRKAVLIFRDLYRAGVPEERIRRVRAPVGLDLGGRQPEDIALSIVAELVAVKNGRDGGPLSMMDDRVLEKIRQIAQRPLRSGLD